MRMWRKNSSNNLIVGRGTNLIVQTKTLKIENQTHLVSEQRKDIKEGWPDKK